MADVSAASLPCFSLDEKTLQLLWDEGIQMEQLLDFSFERIGRLAAERGVHLDDSHKEELWLFIERMKAEQPDWLSLSKFHDRSSRQVYGSCLDVTCLSSRSQFHTARQLSWETLSLDDGSAHTSFLRESPAPAVHNVGAQADTPDGDLSEETAFTKRTCKMPKTFRLSRCDLSPISPKARTPSHGSRSKMAALLGRLVPDRVRGSQAEDGRFFTRGVWPAWLNFTATPKSSPTAQGVGRSYAGTRRQRLPSFLRWIGRQRSRGYRVSAVRRRP